jgi:hypothetical protein
MSEAEAERDELDKRIEASIEAISDAMPALTDIMEACEAVPFHAEGLIAGGLLMALAHLVEGHSVPGSERHSAAQAVIESINDDGDEVP